MLEQKKNKYNRKTSGANQAVFETIKSNTEMQEPVNTAKKKKATFDMDPSLHKRLREYAATNEILQ